MKPLLYAGALLALLGALWGLEHRGYRRGLAECQAEQVARDLAATTDVNEILRGAEARNRARAFDHVAAQQEIANVTDDGTCISPAMDAAFDILLRAEADRQRR